MAVDTLERPGTETGGRATDRPALLHASLADDIEPGAMSSEA